jgi:putative transcriptional regulator
MLAIRSRLKLLLAEKEVRENRRVSHEEIRRATGLASSTISALANNNTGRYDANTLSKLCAYFNCGVGDILEYVPDTAAGKR